MQLVQEHLSVVQCQRLWAAPRARGTPCGQDPGTQLAPQPPHRVCLRGNSFPFLVYLLLRFSCLGVLDSTPKRRLIKHFLMMFFFHFFSPFSFKPCKKGAAPCWFLMPCWCSLELQELGRCCPLAARCCGPHGDAHSTCLGSLRSSPSVWCWQGTCHHTLLLPGTGFALGSGAARPAGGQPAWLKVALGPNALKLLLCEQRPC